MNIIFFGAQRKTGEYKGTKYDNTYITVGESCETGYTAFTCKARTDEFADVTGYNVTSLKRYIFHSGEIEFDRFGRIKSFVLNEQDNGTEI